MKSATISTPLIHNLSTQELLRVVDRNDAEVDALCTRIEWMLDELGALKARLDTPVKKFSVVG